MTNHLQPIVNNAPQTPGRPVPAALLWNLRPRQPLRPFQSSDHQITRSPDARRALTMIELLVVIAIMAILVAMVTVASSTLINQSKATNTRAVLQVVSDAIDEFKRERPAMLRPNYLKRYGPYPPDELEVFAAGGFPAIGTSHSLAPGGATIDPPPDYQPMRFYTDGTDADAAEHRDLAAMIVAIETLTESAASILDRLPDKNRTAGALDADGVPSQFLDRNGDGDWDGDDFQVRYIVDDWGVPLGYFAQRDWTQANQAATRSSNHADWNQASTELIRKNGGRPLIFSWGPDGQEQLTREVMEGDAEASLVVDYTDGVTPGPVVDHPMNADNIYLDETLAQDLAGGTQQ